jgi:hypothetical protein
MSNVIGKADAMVGETSRTFERKGSEDGDIGKRESEDEVRRFGRGDLITENQFLSISSD